jgi:hypothetical protein
VLILVTRPDLEAGQPGPQPGASKFQGPYFLFFIFVFEVHQFRYCTNTVSEKYKHIGWSGGALVLLEV